MKQVLFVICSRLKDAISKRYFFLKTNSCFQNIIDDIIDNTPGPALQTRINF